MALDIHIVFQDSKIFIREPELGLQCTMRNLMAIDTSSMRIVDVGSNEEELLEQSPTAWSAIKSRIQFEKIYEPDRFNSQYLLLTLGTLTRQIFLARYPTRLADLLHFRDRYSLDLTLPGYELIDQEAREFFENQIPEVARVKTLTINGIPVNTFSFQRVFVTWTYQAFWVFSLLLCSYGAILVVSPHPWDGTSMSLWKTLLFALGLFSSIAVCIFAGMVLWAMLIKKLLPARLYHYLIFTSQMLPRPILKFLTAVSTITGR